MCGVSGEKEGDPIRFSLSQKRGYIWGRIRTLLVFLKQGDLQGADKRDF